MKFIEKPINFLKLIETEVVLHFLEAASIFLLFPESLTLLILVLLISIVYSSIQNQDINDDDVE